LIPGWIVPYGPIGHLPHGVGSICIDCYRDYLTGLLVLKV
jgi:hypothetical protein